MLKVIRAFKDNYIWIICNEKSAYVVDPGDAQPVIQQLAQWGLTLSGILLTHHHHDHSGGIADLLAYARNTPVWGSHLSPIGSITHPVKEGDTIDLFSHSYSVREIPGHTLDHVAFIGDNHLFCGDTLFSMGCGKVFEGTYEQMFNSLNKLIQLPDEMRIYCGHEYTLANLQFAKQVEVGNVAIDAQINEVRLRLQSNGCTLPSVLRDEKNANPFLRCHVPEVIHAVEKYANKKLTMPVEIFQYLREWKNTF